MKVVALDVSFTLELKSFTKEYLELKL